MEPTMTAGPSATLATRRSNRRRRSPVRSGQPLIQWTVDHIYDSVVTDNTTTGTQQLFSDAIGTNGKTLLHTNLTTPRAIQYPQVFTILGFVAKITQGRISRTAGLPVTSAQANVVDALLSGAKGLWWTTYFSFTLAGKALLEVPLFLLMGSGYGIEGNAYGGATADVTGNRLSLSKGHGMPYSILAQPRRIIPNESFHGEFVLPIAGAGQTAANGHEVYFFLQGLRGLEVS